MGGFILRGDQDLLYRKVGTTWTRVPNVLSFSESEPATTQVPSTDLMTPKGTTTSLNGRPSGNHQMSYPINFDPKNAVHQALKLPIAKSDSSEWAQVICNDDGTVAVCWLFTGVVASLPVSGTDNQLMSTTLTINCDATPDFDATLPSGIPADLSA